MRYLVLATMLGGCGTGSPTMMISAPHVMDITVGVNANTVYMGSETTGANPDHRFVWFGNRDGDSDLSGTWLSISTPASVGVVDIDSLDANAAALIFWTPGISDLCRTGTATKLLWSGTANWKDERHLDVSADCSADGTHLSASISL